MKNRTLTLIVFAITLLIISSCMADSIDIKSIVEDKPAGFWLGLWHGIIAPVTFILSLFSDSIAMYAVNNNGGWYDFGFVIGAGILFSGGKKASKFKRHRCDEY